jgi:hypothetical protein
MYVALPRAVRCALPHSHAHTALSPPSSEHDSCLVQQHTAHSPAATILSHHHRPPTRTRTPAAATTSASCQCSDQPPTVAGAQDGFTPLHYAAIYNQPAMVERLLEKGADIRAKDMVSHTASLRLRGSSHLLPANCACTSNVPPFTERYQGPALTTDSVPCPILIPVAHRTFS